MRNQISPTGFWELMGFDMNLAALRYRHVFTQFQGPIKEISVRPRAGCDGRLYEAFAYLDQKKCPYQSDAFSLYGNAHGMGTDSSEVQAIYKAISEALERWAWHTVREMPHLYPGSGIEQDPSSSGFAAFPGLTGAFSRAHAFQEALERWSVCAWWERKIAHKLIPIDEKNVNGISLECGWKGYSVAVLWKKNDTGLTAYGFACGTSLDSAVEKASVELGRNQDALSRLTEDNNPSSLLERRLSYFASEAGFSRFSERLKETSVKTPSQPKLKIDTWVMGPWSDYTQIRRCLFDVSELAIDNRDEAYFSF